MQCAEQLRAFGLLHPRLLRLRQWARVLLQGEIAADKVFSEPTIRSLDERGKGSSSDEGCISGTFFCSPNSQSILTCDGQGNYQLSATCNPGYCIDNNEQVFCQPLKAMACNAVSTPAAKYLGQRGREPTSNDRCIPGTFATTRTWS